MYACCRSSLSERASVLTLAAMLVQALSAWAAMGVVLFSYASSVVVAVFTGTRNKTVQHAVDFIEHRQSNECDSVVEIALPEHGYGLGSILINIATCAGAVLLNGSSLRVRGPLGDYMGSYQDMFRAETSCCGSAEVISTAKC